MTPEFVRVNPAQAQYRGGGQRAREQMLDPYASTLSGTRNRGPIILFTSPETSRITMAIGDP
ncbi:hypothetical protein BDM02DRAFT_3114456, partial [Thelephora ganbajun]